MGNVGSPHVVGWKRCESQYHDMGVRMLSLVQVSFANLGYPDLWDLKGKPQIPRLRSG